MFLKVLTLFKAPHAATDPTLDHAMHKRAASWRHLTLAGAALVVLSASGCSSFTLPYIPLIHPAPPDLTPARDSAENMVRLDAALRTGCDSVQYIDKPPVTVGSATSTAPQRWVAHTCQGEISYDVLTEQTFHGPVVKVLAVPAPLKPPTNPDTPAANPAAPPANPDTPPATPETPPAQPK